MEVPRELIDLPVLTRRQDADGGSVTAPTIEASAIEQRWQRVNRYAFVCAGLHLLVPQGLYCELLSGCDLARLPNAPDHVAGLANVRGNLVPVYQLEPLCAMAPRKALAVLVMGELSQAAALVIDGKPRPIDAERLSLREASKDDASQLPAILRPALSEALDDGDHRWYSLDHARLFTALAQHRESE